jgi:hypothetical protein
MGLQVAGVRQAQVSQPLVRTKPSEQKMAHLASGHETGCVPEGQLSSLHAQI